MRDSVPACVCVSAAAGSWHRLRVGTALCLMLAATPSSGAKLEQRHGSRCYKTTWCLRVFKCQVQLRHP